MIAFYSDIISQTLVLNFNLFRLYEFKTGTLDTDPVKKIVHTYIHTVVADTIQLALNWFSLVYHCLLLTLSIHLTAERASM